VRRLRTVATVFASITMFLAWASPTVVADDAASHPVAARPGVAPSVGAPRVVAPSVGAPPVVAPPVVAPPIVAPPVVATVDLIAKTLSLLATPSWPVAPASWPSFADPAVIRVGAMWWAYATGSGAGNLQVMSSPDLRTWSQPSDPLRTLPVWAAPGFTWAPGVVRAGALFLMYYTARDQASGRQCISVASSTGPGGPFVDRSTQPLICQFQDGGSIDPSPFVAPDGTRYLLWKSDNNAIGHPSHIGGARLSADGRGVVGPSVGLLSATQPWQAGVVEGPSMVAAAGHYLLFYGGNHWDTAHAGIGYAICTGPLGPCLDTSTNGPWLSSGRGIGPSGPDVFTGTDGTVKLAFHAWISSAANPSSRRALWITTLNLGPSGPWSS
jgi:hypothetical protein